MNEKVFLTEKSIFSQKKLRANKFPHLLRYLIDNISYKKISKMSSEKDQ